ncbi:MAG: tRNA (adenosine(37)-N6)-threonylcarbamoyltransferase complex ATPase subunit type 1 TsaE [Chloroflexi bacterium]|nr:tRNA (adenosine(37)-N6)-threonylcarbamoyltransferase complex ATPase subunit type 1 TsaE [Chloroflexota bacterium]
MLIERAELTVISRSPQETEEIGEALGSCLRGDEVISLEGELGTGKTTLVKGLARGLGVGVPIASPTFVLASEYAGTSLRLQHLDLYRVEDAREFVASGLEDALWGEAIVAVEWPEKVRHLLPAARLWITLRHSGGDQRRLHFEASGSRYVDLLRRLGDRLAQPEPGPALEVH